MERDSLIGQKIGKYEIKSHLGSGGMAEVYLAYQENLDRYVAIKVMHAFLAREQDFRTRFQRGARAMAALNHPNIVGVYDFDVQTGTYFIVMEFIDGGTLKAQLEKQAKSGTPMMLDQAVRSVLEIADALAYAHSRGMLHRDIKPGNIMLRQDGSAVLTDFGIAKILRGPSFTATGALIGTPAYMPPEQGLGQPSDQRSDLYSLGVLFYQLLTGQLPYDADTPLAIVLKHVHDPVPPPQGLNSDVPDGVQQVVIKAMAKEPEERYQSAHGMAQALRQVIRTEVMTKTLPPELIRDRPTPPVARSFDPESTRIDTTRVSTPVTPARRDTDTGSFDETTPIGLNVPEQSKPPKKRSRVWAGLLVLLAILILLSVGIWGGQQLAINNINATRTAVAAAIPTASKTPTPTQTGIPTETPDTVGTILAAQAETQTAAPTDPFTATPTSSVTPTPTATSTATQTPSRTPTMTHTPDATLTFVAECVEDGTLIDAYTYNNPIFFQAPVNSNFPAAWILENSGSCPWPADLVWHYEEGEDFNHEGLIPLEIGVVAGEQITLTATLRAPSLRGTYESTWQLKRADGTLFGPPLTFSFGTYIPATSTPDITETPSATPFYEDLGMNVHLAASDPCVYEGSDYICRISVEPIGGSGSYDIIIYDADPPARYSSVTGSQDHFIRSRRCSQWLNRVEIRDLITGITIDRTVGFDPAQFGSRFPGGACSTS